MRQAAQLLAAAYAAILVVGCTTEPTRYYVVRGPDAYYASGQASSAQEWMIKRGIYDYGVYPSTWPDGQPLFPSKAPHD